MTLRYNQTMHRRHRMTGPFETMREAAPHVSFMAIMIFLSMYARLLLSPMLVFIQHDLSIGPARATQLFLTLALSYSPVMLFSGFLTNRLLHRQTIALSAALLGLGLVMVALAPTLFFLHIGVAVMGGGAGLYPLAGVASVTAMVNDEIRGRAIAIHELGPNVAFVAAPLAISLGILVMDWRWIAALSGVFALVIALLFERYSVAGDFTGDRPRISNLRIILAKPEFWALTVYFSLAASSTLGVFSILPTFLITSRGHEVTAVNTIIGLSRVSGLGMIFLAGFLLDRIGVRRLVGAIMAITGVLTLLIGLLQGTWMLVAVFLQPVVVVAFFPAAVSAMADLGPPTLRNVAVSVMIPTVNVVAGGVFPAVMGHLTEQGYVEAGFVVLGAAMVLSVGLARMLAASGPG